MKESSKTSIFLAVALFLTVIAYFMQPKTIHDSPEKMVGKVLFENFTDPLEIRSLEIARLDPISGDLNRFQIASEAEGRWTIPSHENYPSDARDQMGQVASAFIGLSVLSVATPEVSDAANGSANVHTLYGVVDPTSDGAMSGGAGIKVVCLGEAEKELARLIIGQEVEGKPELRYIRIPNQHPVYIARISASAMSTRFEDWIEKNLLKIDTFDIRRVNIEDYSIDIDRGTRDPKGSFALNYNDQAPSGQRWTLDSMKLFESGEGLMPMPLANNEELADDALSTMINAVDDLKIVDVRRKPAFLANSLRESSPLNEETIDRNPNIARALAQRGFYFAEEQTLDGKVSDIALYSSNGEIHITMKNGMKYLLRFGSPAGMGAEIAESGNDSESSISLNRFLFIMTEFDESQVEKPNFEPLPDIPVEGDEEADEQVAEAKRRLEEIERANARLQDAYDEQVESGKKQSAELNRRFADWYYIISEDVFKKIHLGQGDLIRQKADAGDTSGISSIDLRTDFEGLDAFEFPEFNELNAPTLPGQEGLFPMPELVENEERGEEWKEWEEIADIDPTEMPTE